MATDQVRRRGRQAEAARNDDLILEAAKAVFVADPEAPVAAVAAHAGVGIAALYRRYPSKRELLRRLTAFGLEQYINAAEDALADDDDAWEAFVRFMQRIVDADTHSLSQRLAGTFRPTDELKRLAQRSRELNVLLFERTKAAGGLRSDLVVDDLPFIFQQVAAVRVVDLERTRELRRRYLALYLDAIHRSIAASLPGPPPTWTEISRRWMGRLPK